MKRRTQYSSDLTDRQWQLIRQLLPQRSRLGRRPIDRRKIINAILYVVRTGCQWRMLPKNLPNWSTVYGIFWNWRNDGVWQRIHDRLREKVRKAAGKKSTPTAAIVDSQSIRTAEGEEREAMMQARKLLVANDTSPLTLWECCWQWWYIVPNARINMVPNGSWINWENISVGLKLSSAIRPTVARDCRIG